MSILNTDDPFANAESKCIFAGCFLPAGFAVRSCIKQAVYKFKYLCHVAPPVFGL